MIRNKRILVGVLLATVSITLTLAQSYSSVKMEALGSEIPEDCLPVRDGIFNCPAVIKEKSLVVQYNADHEINHLGISLFSNETKELLNLPVCTFIERIMLELVLEQSNNDLIQKLDRLRLSLQKNGRTYGESGFTSIRSVLEEIQLPAQFSLVREDNKFAAIWKYNQDDQLVFTFPVSRELIFGTDKKESDDLLNRSLFDSGRLCRENTITTDMVKEADLMFDSEKNIFTRKGAEFMLPVINANTYYQKKGGVFELLFSKDFPAESFTNLVVNNMNVMNHKLHVTHRMYGDFSPDFDISLHEFLCYFMEEYDFFSAATSSDNKQMKLTVILRNKEYNYIHLLLVSAPVENVFSYNGLLTAEFYSNIPQQSIRRLIGDLTNNR